MSNSIQSVRGMNDVMPPDIHKWRYFERMVVRAFSRFGYSELRTPILESTALFARGIGEATDIVEKEMYTFADRKDRSLTMRPEMTASCVRAFIQHSIHKQEPVTRWFYHGPMFRYERMQTGRYRQFYQIGVEAFGVSEPTLEGEQIAMLYDLYTKLGFEGLDVVLNSVGQKEDRAAYMKALRSYLEPKRTDLCGDCQRRLDKNPLRTLDCKNKKCAAIANDAPLLSAHLSDESALHFAGVQDFLKTLEIPFRVDERMVRGLDYYNATVFEIISSSKNLGAQNTIVAGGRYDGLVESLGGTPTPAAGFALGIERNILCLPDTADHKPRPDAFIACHGDEARAAGMALAHRLRNEDFYIEIEHRPISMKAQLKRADKLSAKTVIAIGEREVADKKVTIRDMATRDELPASFLEIADTLRKATFDP